MAATALERMIEKTGKSAVDFRAGSQLGDIFRRAGVKRTTEFERIYFLPRRDWTKLSEDGYLERLSAYLRAPGGTMTLRPSQVAVLTEAHDLKGTLGQIGLGEGKTLITALLATIMNAERPVLLAPAKLRQKTARDFEQLRKHWLIHPRIEFISYQQLGRLKAAELLESISPDLIMCDEVQKLKSLDASCTKRVQRYMRKNPKTMFVGLSGTITKRSLYDYWHLLMWAVGPELMPLPRIHTELEEWAAAVDEKVDEEKRIHPGALLELAKELELPPEPTPLTIARLGLQNRLRLTPGFVMTSDASVGASITLELIRPPKSRAIEDAIRELQETWTTPNGELLVQPMDVWRCERQYGCGFSYFWEPAAPLPWLEKRKNWSRFVRFTLNTSNKLDSPLQVQQAVEKGKLKEPFRVPHPTKPDATILVPPQQLLAEWLKERPKFSPSPKAHWIDDSYMRWLLKHHVHKQDPTIIWVEHVAVGEKLAELSGLSFFHNAARDKKGRFIEDMGGKTVIASVASCGEGLNLQAWARNLVVSCPPNGPIWEQMLGRTHRSGQEADNIEVLVLAACAAQEEGFEQAVRDSRYAFETTGQTQRLLLVDRI